MYHKNKKKLFVGALSPKTTKESLQDYFSQFGTIISAYLIYDKDSNNSKYFGFVEYVDQKDADAVCNINTHILDNKVIVVRFQRIREKINGTNSTRKPPLNYNSQQLERNTLYNMNGYVKYKNFTQYNQQQSFEHANDQYYDYYQYPYDYHNQNQEYSQDNQGYYDKYQYQRQVQDYGYNYNYDYNYGYHNQNQNQNQGYNQEYYNQTQDQIQEYEQNGYYQYKEQQQNFGSLEQDYSQQQDYSQDQYYYNQNYNYDYGYGYEDEQYKDSTCSQYTNDYYMGGYDNSANGKSVLNSE